MVLYFEFFFIFRFSIPFQFPILSHWFPVLFCLSFFEEFPPSLGPFQNEDFQFFRKFSMVFLKNSTFPNFPSFPKISSEFGCQNGNGHSVNRIPGSKYVLYLVFLGYCISYLVVFMIRILSAHCVFCCVFCICA